MECKFKVRKMEILKIQIPQNCSTLLVTFPHCILYVITFNFISQREHWCERHTVGTYFLSDLNTRLESPVRCHLERYIHIPVSQGIGVTSREARWLPDELTDWPTGLRATPF